MFPLGRLINILLFPQFYQRENMNLERQQSTAAAIDAWLEEGDRDKPMDQ
jgi:hypothetical protein